MAQIIIGEDHVCKAQLKGQRFVQIIIEHFHQELHLEPPFAVLIEAIKIRLISKQSSNRDFPISAVMYSDITNSLSQYSVSAVSFSAIWSFAIKSALLCP